MGEQPEVADLPEAIWNRAAREKGGPLPLYGDAVLTAVLRLHSLVMNGGLLDAVQRLADQELDAAENGYTWLGLPDAAEVVVYVRGQIRAGAVDDTDRAGQLEHQADQRYSDVIRSDATLQAAFRRRLAEQPAAFCAFVRPS
jgi:hypothetical protein